MSPDATIIEDALLLLVITNPFAQMVYLSDLMNDVQKHEFREIMVRASAMTIAISLFCAFVGDLLLFYVFQISLPAMRIFGGLVTLYLAFTYIVRGPEGLKLFKGDITELAQQITLPVMVGAGLIWACMKIGNGHPTPIAAGIIVGVLLFNTSTILLYHNFFKNARGKVELRIIKYIGMAMRFNALLIGAVGVEMILGGILNYYQIQ